MPKTLQVSGEVQRLNAQLEQLAEEINNKKERSKEATALTAELQASEHELADLTVEQQDLRRQQASLIERIQRLENQVCGSLVELHHGFRLNGIGWQHHLLLVLQKAARSDAVLSRVEEQQRNKAAILAEKTTIAAKVAENEAAVSRAQFA